MNAIDDAVPFELADCVTRASADPGEGEHIIILSGAGDAFCARRQDRSELVRF
jgi:enoyl-CoA hydratase